MIKDEELRYFECDCHSRDHTICGQMFDFDEQGVLLSLSLRLTPEYHWYKRIWKAIKYIFKSEGNLYMYEETLLNDSLPKLKEFIDSICEYRQAKEGV